MTTTTPQSVEKRFGLHQAGRADARAKVFIELRSLGFRQQAKRREPRTRRCFFLLLQVALIPVCLESRSAYTRKVRSFLSTCAAGPERAAAAVKFVAREAVGLLKKLFSVFESRKIRNTQV